MAVTAPDIASSDVKDETQATMLGLAGTLAGPVLIGVAGGMESDTAMQVTVGVGALVGLVGPSFGHWYAGEASWIPMGVRGLGLAAMAFGGIHNLGCENSMDRPRSPSWWQCGGAELVVGALTYAGGAIYDVATSGDAARRYNASRARGITSVTPLLQPSATGVDAGVMLTGRF